MNVAVPPPPRLAPEGDIETVGWITVTVATALTVGSATLFAVTVYVPGTSGAV